VFSNCHSFALRCHSRVYPQYHPCRVSVCSQSSFLPQEENSFTIQQFAISYTYVFIAASLALLSVTISSSVLTSRTRSHVLHCHQVSSPSINTEFITTYFLNRLLLRVLVTALLVLIPHIKCVRIDIYFIMFNEIPKPSPVGWVTPLLSDLQKVLKFSIILSPGSWIREAVRLFSLSCPVDYSNCASNLQIQKLSSTTRVFSICRTKILTHFGRVSDLPEVKVLLILSRVWVTIDGVWVGNWMYWIFTDVTTSNYSTIANSHILQFTTARTTSSHSPVFSLGCRLETASNAVASWAYMFTSLLAGDCLTTNSLNICPA
jgi:hypothetical protein